MSPFLVAVSMLAGCGTDRGGGDAPCVNAYFPDADADGHGDPLGDLTSACTVPDGYAALGDDCDDRDASVHGGADEICDAIDNDCDEDVDEDAVDSLLWFRDSDADDYGDAEDMTYACTRPVGYAALAGDCDDTDTAVHPDGVELCNQIDDDCDALVDEDDPSLVGGAAWYADTDVDGYGDAITGVVACLPIDGSVDNALDCDDANLWVHPGALEVCDDGDNDCDGLIDDDDTDVTSDLVVYADADGDSFGDPDVTREVCDVPPPKGYVDNHDDCDDAAADVGDALAYYWDADLDGYGSGPTHTTCTPDAYSTLLGGDCNITDATVYPGAPEVCDYRDDNCDGLVDADDPLLVLTSWYADDDGDGFGDAADTFDSCDGSPGYVTTSGDCDDDAATVNPAAVERCDSIDNDCTGLVDDAVVYSDWYADADGDEFGEATDIKNDCVEPSGYTERDGDCDDADATVNPEAPDVCGNGTDDDCDLAIDNCQIDLEDADLTVLGDTYSSYTGISLASGDIDADGAADLLIGASYAAGYAGEVYFLYGPQTGTTSAADLASATTSTVGAYFGAAVAAGDADGDGFDDVLAGGPGYNETFGGTSYLFLGPVTGSVGDADADAFLFGLGEAGSSIAIVSDVDGDATADLLIGAPLLRSGAALGSAYVISGASSGALDLATDATITYEGPTADGTLGWASADLGDMNGDGLSEVAISTVNGFGPGAVYVLDGGAPPGTYAAETACSARIGGAASGVFPHGAFGEDIASADYDGDGTRDLLVGDGSLGGSWFTAGVGGGGVYGFRGPVSGVLGASTDAFVLWDGDETAANLRKVDAGDIDGDGTVDVLLGAPGGASGAGIAYVQLGPTTGTVDVSTLMSFVGQDTSFATWSMTLLSDWGVDGGAEIAIGAIGMRDGAGSMVGGVSVVMSDGVAF